MCSSLLLLGAGMTNRPSVFETTRTHARRAREKATRMRAQASRVQQNLREIILGLQPPRFRPISGASDGRPGGLRESVWISPAVTDGAVCTECGRPIVVGETMYDVAADGREIRLGSRCGRSHIGQVRAVLGANGWRKPSDSEHGTPQRANDESQRTEI